MARRRVTNDNVCANRKHSEDKKSDALEGAPLRINAPCLRLKRLQTLLSLDELRRDERCASLAILGCFALRR